MNNNELKEAFEHVRDIGCIAKVHAETGDIIIQNQRRLLADGVLGPEEHPLAQPDTLIQTPLSFKEWTRQCRYRMNLVQE